MANPNDVTAISITLENSDRLLLFIEVGADGTISRLGSGRLTNQELDLYRGRTSEPIFPQPVAEFPSDLLRYPGIYAIPDPRGVPLHLQISFQEQGEAPSIEFLYGSESAGPPDDVVGFVQRARDLTDPWFQAQKAAVE